MSARTAAVDVSVRWKAFREEMGDLTIPEPTCSFENRHSDGDEDQEPQAKRPRLKSGGRPQGRMVGQPRKDVGLNRRRGESTLTEFLTVEAKKNGICFQAAYDRYRRGWYPGLKTRRVNPRLVFVVEGRAAR